jgi:FMN-dependent NADH-azoreductase
MTYILHIDSSPRGERSISRTLTREFISAWKQIHPGDTVTYRDIGRYPLPPLMNLGLLHRLVLPTRLLQSWQQH